MWPSIRRDGRPHPIRLCSHRCSGEVINSRGWIDVWIVSRVGETNGIDGMKSTSEVTTMAGAAAEAAMSVVNSSHSHSHRANRRPIIIIIIAISPSVSTAVLDPIVLVIAIITATLDGHKAPLSIDVTTINIDAAIADQ